ncbi:MAG: hypothetical protein ACYC3G_02090 [Minisyncoccota bacterium]
MNKGTKSLVNIILALIVISILGGLGYLAWNSGESFVPENFIEAREKSSGIASELVVLLDSSVKNLDKISVEDRAGRFSSALELVEQETEKIEKVRTLALELSSELNSMAQAVQGIEPVNAKNIALEAVTQEVSLIGHLINYNAYFAGLLSTLKMKFVDDNKYDSSDVQNFINNMNKEKDEVNSINGSFNQKLREFDSAIN